MNKTEKLQQLHERMVTEIQDYAIILLVREEVMASANGDRDAMRAAMQEKMKPLTEALDAKLKPILGDDKFKTWKEQIEPTLRGRGGPPRQ